MNRRGFLFGAPALLAAPAIVRVASIMPVSVPRLNWGIPGVIVEVATPYGRSPAVEALAEIREFNAASIRWLMSMFERAAVANSLPPRKWFDVSIGWADGRIGP